ncbi:MAG: methyltransferase domain-containing protein [Oscillospiraceae bacterium]|nr:methyltransferase domain-containing protein [Oscillospiraceae bacterium]
MEIRDDRIDGGKAFDWGRTSAEYARYRDIYPDMFYSMAADRGLCVKGQRVLDLGTGTGVLPRNMYKYGAVWTGTDISPEQIEQARILSQGMDIDYRAVSAEELDFPDGSFDVVTACQCFWYFDHERTMPVLSRLLRDGGRLVVLYMAWLPFEDEIAGRSEQIVLKYSPGWTGAGQTRRPLYIPDVVYRWFEPEDSENRDVMVPFTRDTWHGRMRASRGVGASLDEEALARWDAEHRAMLEDFPERFEVLHYAQIAVLRKR